MPTFRVEEGAPWPEILPARLPEWLARAGPDFLVRQRWYGAKGSPITELTLLDAAPFRLQTETVPAAAFCLVQTQSATGKDVYCLPLALAGVRAALPESAVLAGIERGDERLRLADALQLPAFRQAWLDWLRKGTTLAGRAGVFQAHHAASALKISGECSRLVGAEQSNSSIIYSDPQETPRLIVKLYRRLSAGINPDYETTAFLAASGQFPYLAAWRGGMEYRPDAASSPEAIRSLAMAQDYVPNQGDGWSWLLGQLGAAAKNPQALPLAALPDIARLGEITAAMHRALAAGRDHPDFAPQPFSAGYAARFERQLIALTREVAAELRLRLSSLDAATRQWAQTILPALEPGRRLPAELAHTIELIRIHGDYHLGQVLRTAGDFVVIDFEGEPARPPEERRWRACALKDAAGMLRSLDYASITLERQLIAEAAAPQPQLKAALSAWNQAARAAFWNAYRQALAVVPARLLPESPQLAQAALEAFEWEKAVYELGYELRHRPDWVGLPLAGLARLASSST